MEKIEEKSGWKKNEMVGYKERVKKNFQKECGKLISYRRKGKDRGKK